MTENIDPTEEFDLDVDMDFDAIQEEVTEERKSYDLVDRLIGRPKRKPREVTIYLDEESAEELGFAGDVAIKNEYGVAIGTRRERRGVLGELDKERETLAELKGEEDADETAIKLCEKRIKQLEARARKLVKEIKSNSLTFTLQWLPKIVEEAVTMKAKRSVGVKQGNVPDDKKEHYLKSWMAHTLSAATASVVDNSDGTRRNSLSVSEAASLQKYLPEDQYARLDMALGKLQARAVLSEEALDSADF